MKQERKMKKNRNTVAVDNKRKRRPKRIGEGEEVDMRAQRKGTSIEVHQQNVIT